MRVSVLLALAALLGLWGCALWLWPALPARIPVHFDGSGAPDRIVERSVGAWFLLPAVGTVMVLAFAFALPAWILRLAASNSPFLNVPRKQELACLPPAARERAVAPMVVLMRTIAAEVAVVFGLILWGSARVASGAWSVLPPGLVWIPIGLLLATTIVSVPFGRRAVERELARSGATPKNR